MRPAFDAASDEYSTSSGIANVLIAATEPAGWRHVMATTFAARIATLRHHSASTMKWVAAGVMAL